MNKTVNKFLLAGEKYMPQFHLRQTVYKHYERIQKFRKADNLKRFLKKFNQIKLVFLMLLLILIVNVKLKELFQIDFGKIKLIKLLEIVN